MQTPTNGEGGPAATLAEHDAPSPQRVAAAPTESHGDELVRWFEAHPRWDELGPTDQERALVLARDAPDADVMTRRSVPEMVTRYGWSRGRVQLTLKALREHGIAYRVPQYDFSTSPPSQIGSLYIVIRDGVFVPQAKRELSPRQRLAAQKRARSRAAKEAAKVRRQLARVSS